MGLHLIFRLGSGWGAKNGGRLGPGIQMIMSLKPDS